LVPYGFGDASTVASRSWEGAAQPFVTGETGIAFASKGREKARAVETLKMAMLQVRVFSPPRVGCCCPCTSPRRWPALL
jgi:hypothetical protein